MKLYQEYVQCLEARFPGTVPKDDLVPLAAIQTLAQMKYGPVTLKVTFGYSRRGY